MTKQPLTIEDIILPAEILEGTIDWRQLFANKNPVEVEIGTGKGTFLVNSAQANPQINYLGIEWANKYYKHAANRARRWDLSNIRMIRCDAKDFIIQHTPPRSIRTLHVYFPTLGPRSDTINADC